MTLALYVKKLKEWFTMFIIITVVGTAIGGVYTFSDSALFSASSKVYVRSSDSDRNFADAGAGMSYALSQINNIRVFALSSELLVPVINKHDLHITLSEFTDKYLKVSVITKTTSLQIDVKYSDPRTASDLANDIATGLKSLVNSGSYFNASDTLESDSTDDTTKQPNSNDPKTLSAEVIQYSTIAEQSLFAKISQFANSALIALALGLALGLLLVALRLLLEITSVEEVGTSASSKTRHHETSANSDSRRKL